MEKKWNRIQYMPSTTLGADGKRLTGCAEHIALSRRAACEGMVLLKNEGEALPFRKGAKLAVFGKAQADYVKGGGGSGDVTVEYVRSILDGFAEKQAEGKVEVFTPLSEYYQESVRFQYAGGATPGKTVEPGLPASLLKQAREFTDQAVITICRFSGEGYDRTGEAFDGDYFLSKEEQAMVDAVLSAFDRVTVVLNTGGMMDTSWFRNNPKIQAALLAWQGGMVGGLAMADVLCGDVCPSGRLTDTFAAGFDAYPSSANFNESENYVEYQEDIYVGYRYFETLPAAKDQVCYPFGYGLSYTTFELGVTNCGNDGTHFTVWTSVTNTGKRAGRQVVQLYCQAPQGKLGKPSRVLVGFAKTKLLQPNESEELAIEFDAYDFASYDDTGRIRKSAYILEKGEYKFHIGFNVRDTKEISPSFELQQDQILKQLTSKCAPKHLHRRMLADGSYEQFVCLDEEPRADWEAKKLPFDGQCPQENKWIPSWCAWIGTDKPMLIDVYEGKTTLDEFMKLLDDEQKVSILGGQPNRGVANTFGFGNIPDLGIPNAMTADGPAGLRLRPECGVTSTAFPCATLLACTWDEDVLYAVGRAAALEVHENGIGTWLAPAINIHRTPLCGRNFEYYSEDPLVAGKLSAALVRGVQSVGVATSLKHFACNNKETNRRESDSRVSERALREIYLKGFEICVKEAQPMTIMSSYNYVNGVHSSTNRELLTDILRGEWGFKGAVTTDWYTHEAQFDEINAGNDIKMGCGMPKDTLKRLKSGELSREALETSVRRVLELLLRLA